MTKKLEYEFVKKQFEGEGYTLLSKEYTNNSTNLLYRCQKGHVNSIVYGSWQQGKRCPECSKNKQLTIEEVETFFRKEGYTLLSTKYKNARSLLNYECPRGHRHKTTADNFRRGYRCPFCNGRPIVTIDIVREFFEKEGYEVLTKVYTNSKQKLRYKCPFGHVHSVGYATFKCLGVRCPTCATINQSGSGHWNWQGGISCVPYCDVWTDKVYKEDIKNRDGYKCLNPYCSKKDGRIHLHHVDYNKKNCEPRNLITLCGSCNTKANYDRDWHKAWYQAILKNRYGYK